MKEVIAQLCQIRAEVYSRAEAAAKAARKYDLKRDLTPQEQDEADKAYMMQEATENAVDAIDNALQVLSVLL